MATITTRVSLVVGKPDDQQEFAPGRYDAKKLCLSDKEVERLEKAGHLTVERAKPAEPSTEA
jgi:hypothetical protein